MAIVSAVIAGIAIAVSVIVFYDNRRRDLRASQLARKPVLVFAWDQVQQTWMLSNIGNGPALDVVILQRIDGEWSHPLRMPEMAVRDANSVPRLWYEHWHSDPVLGARYQSVTGERYTTRTAEDHSEIREGWRAIGLDPNLEVEPHWQYR